MKWIFILLLLINAIYLGWEIDQTATSQREDIASAISVPVGTPELTLLSEIDVAPLKDTRTKSGHQRLVDTTKKNSSGKLNRPDEKITGTLSDLSKINPAKQTDNGNTLKSNADTCYTYGPLASLKELNMLVKWLKDRSIKHQQRQTNKQDRQLLRVYIAPQKTNAMTTAILKDLQQKGVEDIRLLTQGNLMNAISLGLFSSQNSVDRRLKEIANKGYQADVIPHVTDKKIYWVDVLQNHQQTDFLARFNMVNCHEG